MEYIAKVANDFLHMTLIFCVIVGVDWRLIVARFRKPENKIYEMT